MKKIKINTFLSAVTLQRILKSKGVQFSHNGYPVFEKEFIKETFPNRIVPFNHRSCVKNKSGVALCYFTNDEILYKTLCNDGNGLDNGLTNIEAVCGFDLSPRKGWPGKLQKFNILISQFFTMAIALKGVKIIPNFRIGNIDTISCLDSYPKSVPYVIGALGCYKRKVTQEDLLYFRLKLLKAQPSALCIYGTLEKEYLEIISEFGIEYRVYQDYRSYSYNKYSKDNKKGV